jgi:REP element-mobilizing transposase RayT
MHEYHPDVEIEKLSIKEDHLHVAMVIPPRYSVSASLGKIKPVFKRSKKVSRVTF